jgi:hypothetical protein
LKIKLQKKGYMQLQNKIYMPTLMLTKSTLLQLAKSERQIAPMMPVVAQSVVTRPGRTMVRATSQELDWVKATRVHTQVSEGQALPSPQPNEHPQLQYRNCIYHAKVFQGHTEKECRAMPITVRNALSTLNISLSLGNKGCTAVQLNILFDTYGAISTGFKPYHNRIRRLHPEVVHG